MTQRAHAKVNIFLKITAKRGDYHELCSRFVQVNDLYDEITFLPKDQPDSAFELEGNFSCRLKQNSIYKAYRLLLEQAPQKVADFFRHHRVKVNKNIPEFAGLGGGSSDAATFLNLTNEILDLRFAPDRLADLSSRIGADVPFFIYGYHSANVSGIGEIVESFEEEPIEIETFTPDIKCDTKAVYQTFREHFFQVCDQPFCDKLSSMNSKDILAHYKPELLNDLLPPALLLYPDLRSYFDKGEWFFSGSGSSLFRITHG